MPTPFAQRGLPISKYWLINDFRRFHRAFYEPDEAFGRSSTGPQGFPLAPLLPITPRPTRPHFNGIRWPSFRASASAATIYVLNGPNLNLLGTREPETYGHATLADVEKLCAETAAQFGLKADCRQSNREGELIDFIHEAREKKAAGIIINAGGYSHTSIALHDAHRRGEDSDRRSACQQYSRPREIFGIIPSPPGPPSRRCAASASMATGSRSTALPPKSAPKRKPDFEKPTETTDRRLTLQPSPTSRIPDQEHGAPARKQSSGQVSRELQKRRQRAHSRARFAAGRDQSHRNRDRARRPAGARRAQHHDDGFDAGELSGPGIRQAPARP